MATLKVIAEREGDKIELRMINLDLIREVGKHPEYDDRTRIYFSLTHRIDLQMPFTEFCDRCVEGKERIELMVPVLRDRYEP